MRKRGEPARIVPSAPSRESTIGIVAPASSFEEARLIKGCRVLNKVGRKTFFLDSILEKDLYFAGTAERRAAELEEMFRRADIGAILCARGGYGSNHVLPVLNMGAVRAHPKMFVGYSDITTLLTYFCDQADMVTYHGPMVVSDYAAIPLTRFNKQLHKGLSPGALQNTLGELTFSVGRTKQPRTGAAQGVLYGGCLSMLAASLGTPYEIQTENTILFIEDVNTKPYQIDRMLMQLKQAGKFKSVRGFIFGEMTGCVQPGGQDYSLSDVIVRVLGDLKVPIGYGLGSGHVTRPWNVTLPIGAPFKLVVEEKRATLTGL
ncbi:MAG TPA: LD-carboxypeptidase [Terriglobales bacterium]|nr:LD-carboxypeptidase [Terriglobales bacterium]